MRINSSDLLTYRKVSNEDLEKGEFTFRHLDEEEITINLKGPKLLKIADKGLPRTDRHRGALYIWWDHSFSLDGGRKEIDEKKEESDEMNTESDEINKGESVVKIDKYDNKTDDNKKDDEESDLSKEVNILFEILNYHQNSNVDLQK